MQVLIVDDEPYMVDYLRKLVDWEQYGFEHVYTAGGGSMARDLLDKYQPELLITDIRMPKISGLDLCRHIFERKYSTKVMILSRYFKDSTGENLSNFVTRCKMEKAAWLLEHTEQKINEIMQRLGYQKSQHFAKIFREQYGVSPKDYKRGIRS